ncbi:MAG: cystathionine gamma-lyase [Acetobacteraceae bacterium]|nr:cystathionine gamma-lyase [Acetobacteraceae bacterium]
MTDHAERFALLLHQGADALRPGDAISPAIVPSSIFHLPGSPEAPFQYGRYGNPGWTRLEEALGSLEGGEAVIFPSGMAAIAAVLFSQLKAGDRVLLPSDGYFVARALAERFLAPFGVTAELRPTRAFADGGFGGLRIVWMEVPSNPGLDVCDIPAVVTAAHAEGALVVADTTTLTPLGLRALDHGADVVVAAGTKAINGHSDALMGHVAARDPAIIEAVRTWRKYSGSISGPFEAWQVRRGLETLEVRYERMCRNAAAVAALLAGDRAVQAVRYPGLPGDPAHNLARAQWNAFGFMVGATFEGEAAAEKFLSGCRFMAESTSFGGVHSSGERRARWGDAVAPGFVRLSLGIEPTAALIAEIERVLATL